MELLWSCENSLLQARLELFGLISLLLCTDAALGFSEQERVLSIRAICSICVCVCMYIYIYIYIYLFIYLLTYHFSIFCSSSAVFLETSKMSQVVAQRFLRQTMALPNFALLRRQQSRVLDELVKKSQMFATDVASEILQELDEVCWGAEIIAAIKEGVSQRVQVEIETVASGSASTVPRKTL